MPAAPLFSVVLPTYNRAKSVAAAVRSVIAQTEADFECLLVDDGSTDDTRRELSAFSDPRLRTWFNAANRGQHACRNQAIREARGSWIAFLDSDDLYLPGRLEALKSAIASAPEIDFWFTNAYVHRYGRVIGTLFPRSRPLPRGAVPGYYAVGDEHLPYVTSTVVLRRSLFDQVGFFREDLRILEDTELYARMFLGGAKVAGLGEPSAVRFLHEGQITRDYIRDFIESAEAIRSAQPPPATALRLRRKIALENATYLWKALQPTPARRLLIQEWGPSVKIRWAYIRTFLPIDFLGLLRGMRRLWLGARYHPLLAPSEFNRISKLIESFSLDKQGIRGV